MRARPALSAELALTAGCALVSDEALTVLLARLDPQQLDWKRVEELLRYHEVSVLAGARIAELRPDMLPTALKDALARAAIPAVALQAAQTRIACNVIEALEGAGIPALIIKGAGVAYLLYGSHPEWRGANDVDVLIAPEQLVGAQNVLHRLGLHQSWPSFELPAHLQPMLFKLANVYDFREPRLDFTVELHARPTMNPHAFPIPFADLHDSSTNVETPQGRLRVLDGPANLAYLSHHALTSSVFRLKWFGDIARAERRCGLSADRCVAEASPALPRSQVRVAARLLRWFERAIAAIAEGREAPAAGGRLARIVRSMEHRAHMPTERSLARLPQEFANLWFTQAVLPGWRARAYDWLLFASDPRDVSTLRLGSRFAWVYLFAGPLLSLGRHAGLVARTPKTFSPLLE